MQNVNTRLEQRLENHKWQLASIKALASVKRPQEEFKPYVIPLSLTRLWPFFLREISLIFNWLFADKRIKSSLLFLFAQPELI